MADLINFPFLHPHPPIRLQSLAFWTLFEENILFPDVDAVKRELPIEMYEVKMNRPSAHQISNYLYVSICD